VEGPSAASLKQLPAWFLLRRPRAQAVSMRSAGNPEVPASRHRKPPCWSKKQWRWPRRFGPAFLLSSGPAVPARWSPLLGGPCPAAYCGGWTSASQPPERQPAALSRPAIEPPPCSRHHAVITASCRDLAAHPPASKASAGSGFHTPASPWAQLSSPPRQGRCWPQFPPAAGHTMDLFA